MSPRALPLLVFTDLDGTLIDHQTYSAEAAATALAQLRACGAGLIMASSKTGPEIAQIRRDLGWSDWPAIVENGSGLLAAGAGTSENTPSYDALRERLNALPATLRVHFRGFGDMSVDDLAKVTGLTARSALLAKERAFSEPGIWTGTKDQLAAFLDHLSDTGISAREGGRFLTLSFGQTKADQMAGLIDTYAPLHTVALGDAPNDVEMLQAADTGIIVANPHRTPLPPLDGEPQGRIRRTTQPGPEGWNAAILALLQSLNLT